LEATFSEGWQIESVVASQYEVRSDSPGFDPKVGGPKAWFLVARRTAPGTAGRSASIGVESLVR